MKLVTVLEMRAIEQEADTGGLSYARMVENAGRGLAGEIQLLSYPYPDPDRTRAGNARARKAGAGGEDDPLTPYPQGAFGSEGVARASAREALGLAGSGQNRGGTLVAAARPAAGGGGRGGFGRPRPEAAAEMRTCQRAGGS